MHGTVTGDMPAKAAIDGLRSRLRGEVFAPGDDSYDEARSLWNGMIDRRPGVIVRAAGVDDVAEAVRFAGEHDLVVTARGGGHGVAGNALSDGGLVVDLSAMKGIRVDTAARRARAEGGVTLGELDAATQRFGFATPLGVVTETGIAGLTLSGGIGWLRRKHGLAADNLVSADVVTASGELLRASEAENPDLLWALRGGGGSFGVVTALEYRLHPVGPDVFFVFVLYPGERAREILRSANELSAGVGDDVSPLGILGRVPHADAFPPEAHGRPYVAIAGMYAGDAREGERALAPLRELGDPIADLSGVMQYVEAQAILDEDYPDGWRYYWSSIDLDELGDEALDRLVEAAESAPSDHSTIDVWFHGGAMGRVRPEDTAFGGRPAYLIGVEANWDDEHDSDANIAWAREAVSRLRPLSSGGGYLNFPGFFEEGQELLRASFGARNYERLAALKGEIDPLNRFSGTGAIRAGAVSA